VFENALAELEDLIPSVGYTGMGGGAEVWGGGWGAGIRGGGGCSEGRTGRNLPRSFLDGPCWSYRTTTRH